MSACTQMSYSNVTTAAWACVQSFAAGHGVTVNGNSGQATKDGFTVHWNYDPSSEVASIQCTDSPWIVPCSVIDHFINTEAHKCLATHNIVMRPMINV